MVPESISESDGVEMDERENPEAVEAGTEHQLEEVEKIVGPLTDDQVDRLMRRCGLKGCEKCEQEYQELSSRLDASEEKCQHISEVVSEFNMEIEDAKKAIRAAVEQDCLKGWYRGDGETLAESVRLFAQARRNQHAALFSRIQKLHADVLMFLRSFGWMLSIIESAGTHAEKAARLRGLGELVESAARRLREVEFRKLQDLESISTDIFQVDYPVRHFMEKARTAEQEAKLAKDRETYVRDAFRLATGREIEIPSEIPF